MGAAGLACGNNDQLQPEVNQVGNMMAGLPSIQDGLEFRLLGDIWFFKAKRGPKKTSAGRPLASLKFTSPFRCGSRPLYQIHCSKPLAHWGLKISRPSLNPPAVTAHSITTFLNFPTQNLDLTKGGCLLPSALTPQPAASRQDGLFLPSSSTPSMPTLEARCRPV